MLVVGSSSFRWGRPSIGDYTTGSDRSNAHKPHTICRHAHSYKTCRYSPGHLVPNKWESCYTIQQSSWGYDRTVSANEQNCCDGVYDYTVCMQEGIDQFWDTLRLLHQLVESVSCNG